MIEGHTSHSATHWQKSGGIDQFSGLLAQSNYLTRGAML